MQKEPEVLTGWHYEALALYMVQIGIKQIARRLNVFQNDVRRIVKSKIGREAIEQMRAQHLDTILQVQTEIQGLAPKALGEMRKELDSEQEEMRHRAARWILEAAGHTPIRRLEIRRQNVEEDDLNRLTFDQLRQKAIDAVQPNNMIETTATNVTPDDETPLQ